MIALCTPINIFVNGARGAYNEVKPIPRIFYHSILDLPKQIRTLLKICPVVFASFALLGALDREFGAALIQSFFILPVRNVYWLMTDPLVAGPIIFKSLLMLTALTITSLAVGLLLGLVVTVILQGSYGFYKGVSNSIR